MSRTFFNALGHHFLQKHAGRVPWSLVLNKLREHDVLPGIVPRLPFVEPDPISVLTEPIGPAIPEELLEAKEEEPAPEPRPKSKPKGEETSESD